MSYPFGGREDYTPVTVSLARDAGFSCACTTENGSVDAGADLLQLPRYVVRNLNGREFATMVSVWLGS
jgi:hypothetical protein